MGDREQCFQTMHEILPRLKAFYASNPKTTSSLKILSSEDDVLNEGLDELAIPLLIGGDFPVVYLNVTYEPDVFDRDDLKAIEAEYELMLIGTGGVIDPWD
jgi:hypothetical protein